MANAFILGYDVPLRRFTLVIYLESNLDEFGNNIEDYWELIAQAVAEQNRMDGAGYRSSVVVPAIIVSEASVLEHIEKLEAHGEKDSAEAVKLLLPTKRLSFWEAYKRRRLMRKQWLPSMVIHE